MQAPTIVYQHVSSIYVLREGEQEMAEVGWFANTTQSNKKPSFLLPG